MNESAGIYGVVTANLYDKDGNLKQTESSKNLILDRGIDYLLSKIFSRFSTSVSSSSITYRPDLNPFTNLVLGYSDGGGGIPVVPTATESNGETNSAVSTIHKTTPVTNNLDRYQVFTTPNIGGTQTIKFITVGTDIFAMTVDWYDANASTTYQNMLRISKWNNSIKKFEGFQSFSLYGYANYGISSPLVISGTTYVGISGYYNASSGYNTPCTVIKYNTSTQAWELFQNISSGGTSWGGFRNVIAFSFGGNYFLLFVCYINSSSVQINAASKLFKWNGSTFVFSQDLPGNSPYSAAFFNVGSNYYITIHGYADADYTSGTYTYKWNGTTFDTAGVKTLTIDGGLNMPDIGTMGSDIFLIGYCGTAGTGGSLTVGKTYAWKFSDSAGNFDSSTKIELPYRAAYMTKIHPLNTSTNYAVLFSETTVQIISYNGTSFDLIATYYKGYEMSVAFNDIFAVTDTVYIGSATINSINIYNVYLGYPIIYKLPSPSIGLSATTANANASLYLYDNFDTSIHNLKEATDDVGLYVISNSDIENNWFTKNQNNTDAIDIGLSNPGYLTINLNTQSSDITSSVFTAPFVYLYAEDDFEIETYISHTPGSNDRAGIYIRDYMALTESGLYIINKGSSGGPSIETGSLYNSTLATGTSVNNHNYLKIKRSGNTITLSSKNAANDSWTDYTDIVRTDLSSSLQIGLVAYSTAADGVYAPKFDYLKINYDTFIAISDVLRTFSFTTSTTINTIGLGSRGKGSNTYDYPQVAMQWGSRVNIPDIIASSGDTLTVKYRIKMVS